MIITISKKNNYLQKYTTLNLFLCGRKHITKSYSLVLMNSTIFRAKIAPFWCIHLVNISVHNFSAFVFTHKRPKFMRNKHYKYIYIFLVHDKLVSFMHSQQVCFSFLISINYRIIVNGNKMTNIISYELKCFFCVCLFVCFL